MTHVKKKKKKKERNSCRVPPAPGPSSMPLTNGSHLASTSLSTQQVGQKGLVLISAVPPRRIQGLGCFHPLLKGSLGSTLGPTPHLLSHVTSRVKAGPEDSHAPVHSHVSLEFGKEDAGGFGT